MFVSCNLKVDSFCSVEKGLYGVTGVEAAVEGCSSVVIG